MLPSTQWPSTRTSRQISGMPRSLWWISEITNCTAALPISFELWFAATHPGGAECKPAVEQAQMMVPARNKDGDEQHIAFPEIADQKVGTEFP